MKTVVSSFVQSLLMVLCICTGIVHGAYITAFSSAKMHMLHIVHVLPRCTSSSSELPYAQVSVSVTCMNMHVLHVTLYSMYIEGCQKCMQGAVG